MLKPLCDKKRYLFLSNHSQYFFPATIVLTLLAAPFALKPASAQKGDESPETVSIQREAITLRHPRDYYVPLNLKPVHALTVSAPIDGIIRAVDIKPGDKPTSKAVLIRLDPSIREAEVSRADAALNVASLELKNATGKSVEIYKAKQALAEAELKIAKIRLEQTIVRAPFQGEVFRIFTQPGAYIRAGEPLLELGDTSKLQVEIPLQRDQAKTGALSKSVSKTSQLLRPLIRFSH